MRHPATAKAWEWLEEQTDMDTDRWKRIAQTLRELDEEIDRLDSSPFEAAV